MSILLLYNIRTGKLKCTLKHRKGNRIIYAGYKIKNIVRGEVHMAVIMKIIVIFDVVFLVW
jgi:hypothetical protein